MNLKILFANDDGFTLTESLFSIFIILILTTSITFLSIGIFRNSNEYLKNIENTKMLLQTDENIRKKIKSINIPYYENSNTIIEKVKSEFYLTGLGENIKLIKIENFYNTKSHSKGLEVHYKFDFSRKEYITKEVFNSEVIIKK